jgi:hypothetical protein
MSPRRSPKPATWLSIVESASGAFTGTARLVDDSPASTSARGDGFRVTAEITPGEAVFGPLPGGPVTVDGTTRRPPDRRPDPAGPRFPPDSLREVPYWDQARSDTGTPVLCVQSSPPAVRTLLGADDDLPRAVDLIRNWVAREADVLDGLPGAPAPAFVAGFELLLRTTADLPGLLDGMLAIPDRPGAAVRGIVALLPPHTNLLPDVTFTALARVLLAALSTERNPEALVALLTWFGANSDRTSDLGKDVMAAAERASTLTFAGPDGDAWHQEVTRFAGPLS